MAVLVSWAAGRLLSCLPFVPFTWGRPADSPLFYDYNAANLAEALLPGRAYAETAFAFFFQRSQSGVSSIRNHFNNFLISASVMPAAFTG